MDERGLTRRAWLGTGVAAMSAVEAAAQSRGAQKRAPGAREDQRGVPAAGQEPWYRRAYRWGQTNIVEQDPVRYDIAWWRSYWKETAVQAVIINAGGIVAYYPSRFPLHHRAEFLNGRDLYGELASAAHEDGLFVMARMDSNRTAEDFYQAHPDWFTRNRAGEPYRAADKYITCINSGYYERYLPEVITEIIERSHPEGVTDNSWAGMGRENICYCANCEKKFRARTGKGLPAKLDWNDPLYRDWILWNYERRLEVWELNNRTTRAAGGPHCIWSGMNSGSVTQQAKSFRDLREIARRAEILMLDHQRRDDDTGLQQNGDTGKRVHELMGWDKLAPESMAMYQSGPGYFRVASKPAAEARMWMVEGIAGGIQPWWHFVAAYHEDRRMYRTPGPVMQWCRAHQDLLVDRTPVATVGLGWSQRNTDFYGRGRVADRVDAPYTGMMHALVRARVPYVPVHLDDVEKTADRVRTLILPNVAALSDAQCESLRRYVAAGGSLLVTGETSLYNEWGEPRADFGLADVLGVHRREPAGRLESDETLGIRADRAEVHTYLRLSPELRAEVAGPHVAGEPPATGRRHAVLGGFEETDLLPYGGTLAPVTVDAGAEVPFTFVPPFPTYPPETAWMRHPVTDVPGLVLREKQKSRVAFLLADLDRRYAWQHLPDHGTLLANVVRWLAGDSLPVAVEGPGLIDCHLYQQKGRWILHLVNLTNAATWRSPMEDVIPVGPLRVRLRGADSGRWKRGRLLVAGGTVAVSRTGDAGSVTVGRVEDHEVVVFEE